MNQILEILNSFNGGQIIQSIIMHTVASILILVVGYIGKLILFRIVDTADEVMEAITGFFEKYRKEMVPNF